MIILKWLIDMDELQDVRIEKIYTAQEIYDVSDVFVYNKKQAFANNDEFCVMFKVLKSGKLRCKNVFVEIDWEFSD